MHPIYIILIVLGGLALVFFSTCYICFRLPFYVSKKQKLNPPSDLPFGEGLANYNQIMKVWMDEFETTPYVTFKIKSYDNLDLYARYYENVKGAPVEIMFHGYRGSAKRDLSGGLYRCKKLSRNALIVDMRASGKSHGKVITFGIKERYDVKSWADFAYNHFGDNVPLIITGISMGASSVIMASSLDLPKTVVGGVADCGYSSGRDIINRVVKLLKLPHKLFFPFIKMGGIIFGGFNIDQTTPEKEARKAKIPIIFLHGEKDNFVPKEMSQINYNAFNQNKRLVLFENADHGTSFLVDPEKYLNALKDFEKEHLKLN